MISILYILYCVSPFNPIWFNHNKTSKRKSKSSPKQSFLHFRLSWVHKPCIFRNQRFDIIHLHVRSVDDINSLFAECWSDSATVRVTRSRLGVNDGLPECWPYPYCGEIMDRTAANARSIRPDSYSQASVKTFHFTHSCQWKLTHQAHKRKDFSDHAVKAYGGRRGTAPLILNLGTRGVWSNSCPCRFNPGRLGVPQRWSGGCGEEIILLRPPGFECCNVQPAAQALKWLYYPG